MFNTDFQDCYVHLDESTLTIGNDRMERTWDMTGPRPAVRTMVDKETGRKWLTEKQESQWEEWPEDTYAFYRAGITEGKMKIIGAEAHPDNDLGIAEDALRITVSLTFDGFQVDWLHVIYPRLPVMRSFLRAKATGKRFLPNMYRAAEWPQNFQDAFPLDCLHGKYRLVQFADHTDDMENLVQEQEGLLSRRNFGPLQGNLLFIRDDMKNDGVIFVKEGPVPLGYLPGMDRDFFLKGLNVFPACWGFDEGSCRAKGHLTTYGSAVILYHGDEENAYSALHAYFRAQKRFIPHRDAHIMSNTWGDGTADGSIGEAFLLAELKRAKELGVTLFQIDDGWEKGTTGNSVNAALGNAAWGEGYYKSHPDFWGINEKRLPNSLEPIVQYAKENGIELGLWFSPDSLNDFEAWERDADTVISLHRKYGIKAFKIDGLIFRNKRCEENFGLLMQKVVQETDGQVFFNLDTTAGVRNGYTGRCQYGNLFIENRFTNRFGKWPNYWPHFTLRNLWKLSRYLPAERLQMEFVNVLKHQDLYPAGDPLAPAQCGVAFALAVTLFSNPLVWMEMTGLDKASVKTAGEIIRAYRPVQADILGGFVQPIGEEPDGMRWTGFQSTVTDQTGYLLVLREWNEQDAHPFRLHGLREKKIALEPILGACGQNEIHTDEAGTAVFSLPDGPHSFALYQYRVL